MVSGVEATPGKKDPEKVRAFVRAVRGDRSEGWLGMATVPRTSKVKIPTLRKSATQMGHPRLFSRPGSSQEPGRFGVYGGRYVPETLMAALDELGA